MNQNMSQFNVLALKQKLKNQERSGSNTNSKTALTFVTRSTKVSKPIEEENVAAVNNINSGLFSSNFLNMIHSYANQNAGLAQRPLFCDNIEQLELTRVKADTSTLSGVPVTAASVVIRENGVCQFCIVTDFYEQQTIDINLCTEENIATQIPYIDRLSDSYVFCLGLPKTLPEVQMYESNFQVESNFPFPHARSKHCYLWYEHTKGVSIRERLGMEKPRCSACKKYLSVIAKWCRDKSARSLKEAAKKTKLSTETEKLLSSNSDLLTSNPKKRGRQKSVCLSPVKTQETKQRQIEKRLRTSDNNKFVSKCSVSTQYELPFECSILINEITLNTAKAKKVALLALCASASALYDRSDDVVELTASNFNNMVINSDEVWLVEFYAPWCGHCRSLAPDWKKAATALKGVVRVGAVDMDQHQSVGGPYNVRGFPTIKVFAGNKQSPQDYQGARSAQAIVDEGLKAAQRVVKDRLSGRGGGSRSSGSGGSDGSGNDDDVITLTDANFEKEVLNAKELVLVEFYAPWCGHCQRLAPEWAKAATELKGKVKVAALDATVHTVTASRFQVQGYPTIKYFPAGNKDYSSAADYQGGRTASDIIAYALEMFSASVDPPEILELTSNDILTENCNEKPLCVVSFLPDILDTGAEGRNNYINILKELGEKYKRKQWGWVWTAAGLHGNLESALGVGGFGYPAMAVVNVRKKVYVILRGSFGKDGIDELLKSIAVGRGRTEQLRSGLPTIDKVSAWDGKDGELPVEEDYDLSDVDLDDMEDDKKDEL